MRAVAAGGFHVVALEGDGTVVTWGSYPYSPVVPSGVPAGLTNVVAVAASAFLGMALAPDGSPCAMAHLADQNIPAGDTARFIMAATGAGPLSYQWQFNGTNLLGANQAWLILENVQTNQSGNYSVVVSNPLGTVTSSTGVLTVQGPPVATPHFTTSGGKIFVSNGQFHVSIDGAAGTQIVLLESEDLVKWTPLQTNTLPEGGLQWLAPVGASNCYFRLSPISNP